MPKQSTLAKGFARGLTADLAGVAGDTANNMANLLRAGFGYAGHKLGMLKAEDMPELVENKDSPFTSDWLAKNTPLEDTGEAGYTAARIAGGLAPALVGFAKGSAGAKPTAPGVMDEKGALLVPESFLNQHNLNTASDAKIKIGSGEILRPLDARLDLAALKNAINQSTEIPLEQLYPNLAGKSFMDGENFLATPLPPTQGGFYSPLEGKTVVNSARPFEKIAGTVAHEANHALQSRAGMLDVGSNSRNFTNYDAVNTLRENAEKADASKLFPEENLSRFYDMLERNPHNSYLRSEGETTARVGGGAAELMSQGGSQVPTQQLLDALTRREGGYKDAIISPHLKLLGGEPSQVYLPAHLGRKLTNKEGSIFDGFGNHIGFSPAYR